MRCAFSSNSFLATPSMCGQFRRDCSRYRHENWWSDRTRYICTCHPSHSHTLSWHSHIIERGTEPVMCCVILKLRKPNNNSTLLMTDDHHFSFEKELLSTRYGRQKMIVKRSKQTTMIQPPSNKLFDPSERRTVPNSISRKILSHKILSHTGAFPQNVIIGEGIHKDILTPSLAKPHTSAHPRPARYLS